MTDISIKLKDESFRLRCVGILIKDNHILMAHADNENYYYGLGGALTIGETLEECVVREVLEETGYQTKVNRLLFSQENFFECHGVSHHEITFFYLLDLDEEVNFEKKKILDNDNNSFEWLNIDEISQYKLFPAIYNKILKNML